jgi:Peptidase inhibitor I78 family
VAKAITLRAISLVLTLALAACALVTGPAPDRMPPEPAPDADVCGASGMQDLVGKDKSIFASMTFPMGTRIIEPGMAITEDYSPTRLNFDLNGSGRIIRVWCG